MRIRSRSTLRFARDGHTISDEFPPVPQARQVIAQHVSAGKRAASDQSPLQRTPPAEGYVPIRLDYAAL